MERITIQGEKLDSGQLHRIVKVLKRGGLIIYPTETAYGLGALCDSKEGLNKLLKYKGSREGQAISVALPDRNSVEEYVESDVLFDRLVESQLPGPLTVIGKFKSDAPVQREIIAPGDTIGIRVPDHALVQQITKAVDSGITATSANISGDETPYDIDELIADLPEEKLALIDLIIDVGRLPGKSTTTIVDTTLKPAWVLRGDGSGLEAEREKIAEWKISEEAELGKVVDEFLEMAKLEVARKNDDLPLVILLSGELGSGKTHFVKYLAKALGVDDNVLSPSFVLERQYDLSADAEKSRGYEKLYHYDFWRLDQENLAERGMAENLEQLGIRDALAGKNIIAIEWPEKLGEVENFLGLLTNLARIDITNVNEDSNRVIRLKQIS